MLLMFTDAFVWWSDAVLAFHILPQNAHGSAVHSQNGHFIPFCGREPEAKELF